MQFNHLAVNYDIMGMMSRLYCWASSYGICHDWNTLLKNLSKYYFSYTKTNTCSLTGMAPIETDRAHGFAIAKLRKILKGLLGNRIHFALTQRYLCERAKILCELCITSMPCFCLVEWQIAGSSDLRLAEKKVKWWAGLWFPAQEIPIWLSFGKAWGCLM